jgi:hypothetical protein
MSALHLLKKMAPNFKFRIIPWSLPLTARYIRADMDNKFDQPSIVVPGKLVSEAVLREGWTPQVRAVLDSKKGWVWTSSNESGERSLALCIIEKLNPEAWCLMATITLPGYE